MIDQVACGLRLLVTTACCRTRPAERDQVASRDGRPRNQVAPFGARAYETHQLDKLVVPTRLTRKPNTRSNQVEEQNTAAAPQGDDG
jgi:hypothetical protein